MKTAIYVRVSTQEQTTENQKTHLVNYCQKQGWQFEVFEEQESTRKTRPVKEQLLNDLRQKRYDCLLIWKLDRWGRSLQELVGNLKELTDKGVKIISLNENIDYTTSSGQLFANMLSCFAQYERSIIRERTMLGLQRAKKEGKTFGRPKGTKDGKVRRKSGYFLRWKGKTKAEV